MKNASFVLLVVALSSFAFTLGLGLGVGDHHLLDAVYSITYGIWIPGIASVLAVPAFIYALYADKRAKAEKFVRWCSAGLGFADEEKARNAFLDAIVLALDTEVIRSEDVRWIFCDAAPSDIGRTKLYAELAERIQARLKSGIWNLAGADTNRRRLIESFGYFKGPHYI